MATLCCDHDVEPEMSQEQSLRLLTTAIEGLYERCKGSILPPEELTAELETLLMFSYIAHGWAKSEEDARRRKLLAGVGVERS